MINAARAAATRGAVASVRCVQCCLLASDNAADKIMSHRTTTRADLLEAVYGTCPGLSRAQARDVVEQALDEICNALVRGETVKLRSFGAFSVRSKRARVGRNPKTGEEYPITARRVLTFRPSPRLISAVNGEEHPEDEPVLGRALSSTSV